MLAIVDYGMANLRSVQKAFERHGHAARIITAPGWRGHEQPSRLVYQDLGFGAAPVSRKGARAAKTQFRLDEN